MKKTIKSLIKALSRITLMKQLMRKRAGLASVLLYHRVTADASFPASQANKGLEVSESVFEHQMAWLAEQRLATDIPSLTAQMRDNSLSEFQVAITFDDGYLDNYEVALPILERYNIPATIFITTGFLDDERIPWWHSLEERLIDCPEQLDEQFNLFNTLNTKRQDAIIDSLAIPEGLRSERKRLFLTKSELHSLAEHPLITIGAHTVNHPVLSCLTKDELEKELVESKRALEELLNKDIEHFAYPHGQSIHASEREYAMAQEIGFITGWTTIDELISSHKTDINLHALSRIYVSNDMGANDLFWRMLVAAT